MAEVQIFSLQQVVQSIQKTISDRYKQAYWIKAELHKLNQYPSGHCFPELVQKEGDKIVAQMSGTIWKTSFDQINKRFHEVVKEPIQEGSTLLFLARLQFNPTFGMTLLILDIDPNYALGELQREKEETLKYLKNKGLLNKNQLLPFPLIPKRIAIISAETSKGLSDFLTVFSKRKEYFVLTHLFSAYLQGNQAVDSIIEQLERIEKYRDLFDIVVIVRGGGGEAGMTCYNHVKLCEKIANFPLPILTGIGHSTNFTVAELIAYQNGITPTELAEIILKSFDAFALPLNEASILLKRTSEALLEQNQENLTQLSQLLKVHATRLISGHVNQREMFQDKLLRGAQALINTEKQTLLKQKEKLILSTRISARMFSQRWQEYQQKLPLHALARVASNRAELSKQSERLKHNQQIQIEKWKNELSSLEVKTELLSPVSVLKRGYSITMRNGKTISSQNQPHLGEKITTITSQGSLESTIENIDLKNEG